MSLYELLYHQPSHRNIDSPASIFFKIKDKDCEEISPLHEESEVEEHKNFDELIYEVFS